MTKNTSYPMIKGVLPLEKISSNVEEIKKVLEKALHEIQGEDFMDNYGAPELYTLHLLTTNRLEVHFLFTNRLHIHTGFKIPYPTEGLLQVSNNVEVAFFFDNASVWYLTIRKQNRPNGGRIFNLLTAQSYIEVSAKNKTLDAHGEFNFNKKFGAAHVKARLYTKIGGAVSVDRSQIGGYLEVGGFLDINLWGISARKGYRGILGVEAPSPSLTKGKVCLAARLKIRNSYVAHQIVIPIQWKQDTTIDRSPIIPFPKKNSKKAVKQIQGVHMLTGETFDLIDLTEQYDTRGDDAVFNNAIIPLDTYIDIKFLKGLSVARSNDPNNQLHTHLNTWGITQEVQELIGGISNPPEENQQLMPPQKTVKGGHTLRQVQHKYHINGMNIEAWNGTHWISYNPYKAVTAKNSLIPVQDVSDFTLGHWQKTSKAYDQIRLLSSNPFTYMEQRKEDWYAPEELGITTSTLFCESQPKPLVSVNWKNRPRGERYYMPSSNPNHFFNIGPLFFQVTSNKTMQAAYGKVATQYSNFDFPQSLKIHNRNIITLKFPNAVQEVRLKLSSTARGVHIRCYKTIIDEEGNSNYTLIPGGDIYKFSSKLYREFVFSNTEQGIDRVEIDPETENVEKISIILEEIAQLLEDTSTIFSENPRAFLRPKDQERYDLLLSELEEVKSIGCDIDIRPPKGIGAMQIGTNADDATFIVEIDAFGNEGIDEPLPSTNNRLKCYTLLHEVQWLSLTDWEYNQEIPTQEAIRNDVIATINAATQVAQPIWRPDTSYRVTFTVSDLVDKQQLHSFPYRFGFKTAGPLGHFHNAPYVTYGNERDSDGLLLYPDTYPLTNLASYIDYERSYPNANSNLYNAKPMFYGTEGGTNEIKLFFTKPYLNHMMGNWEAFDSFNSLFGEMKIVIKSAIKDITLDMPIVPGEDTSEMALGIESWNLDDHPRLPLHIQTFQNLLDRTNSDMNSGSCPIGIEDKMIPKSYYLTVTINHLKPEKIYTAIVNSHYKDKVVPVHVFDFQTSRYKSFKEQVESCLFKDEFNTIISHAIYDIPVSVTSTQIQQVYTLIAEGFNNNAFAKAIDPFDSAVEELLKIKPLDPAVTTEFNLIKNTENIVVGLLIRNPEPFNNPDISRIITTGNTNAHLKTITIIDADGIEDTSFKMIHAKDYTQCLIMKQETIGENSMYQISDTSLNFQFRYLKWDGNVYANRPENQIVITNLQINKE